MIVFWIILSVIAGNIYAQAQQSSIIETHPSLPNNTVATGYEGLQLKIQIQREMYETCIWHYGNTALVDIYNPVITCNDNDEPGYILSCDLTNNLITSIWTILLPISESGTISVECQLNLQQQQVDIVTSFYLNVMGCSVTYPLVVVSTSKFYNSSGTFSCANNGTLVYSNGTQLTSIQTTCLATAEWSGETGLECWKAPDVVINGELTVIEGDDVMLNCDYVDVFPFGNESAFYFGDVSLTLDKGQRFTISVKRSDNNKPVSCQALTPFTKVYPETGRSDARSIKVLYAPYQDNPTTCTWFAGLSQICKISFYANTNVTVQRITKDGTLVDGIVSPVSRDGDDLVSLHFGLFQDITFDDTGSYQVQLTSIVQPYIHMIYFKIDVAENVSNQSCQSNEGFLIGLICIAVYAVLVSVLAAAIYIKSSKDLKPKDQRVSYKTTTSKSTNPIPDGTYMTIDDVKSSTADNNKPTEYLTPNEIKSKAAEPLPTDGYENMIVDENEDVESKTKSPTNESYENFAGNEGNTSKKTKNPTSSKPSDEYEIMNP